VLTIVGADGRSGGTAITVTVTDPTATDCRTSTVFQLTIGTVPAITIAPSTVPNGAVGGPYNQTFTASGGTGPFSFALSLGALPPGLTLTQAGVLSGTLTTPGTFSFSVRATDANGFNTDRAFTMSIATGVPTLPGMFVVVLALGLAGVGYVRLRRRARTD
jgi:hypothetical protein